MFVGLVCLGLRSAQRAKELLDLFSGQQKCQFRGNEFGHPLQRLRGKNTKLVSAHLEVDLCDHFYVHKQNSAC